MRKQGIISKWNDEKGFGFILPNDSKKTVFVHIFLSENYSVTPMIRVRNS
jgi:cold shock CspA family protein